MADSTPAAAVAEFLGSLRQAIACVTRARVEVSADGYRPNPQGRAHLLDVNRAEPVAVGGRHRLSLRVAMRYRIIRADGASGPWKIKTAGYAYAIDDRDGHEVLAYHWQEGTPPPCPHLHLGAGAGVNALVQTRHLPTGRVALEAVVRLLVEEFEVPPLRRDWRTVLRRGEERFKAWRTWA